MSPEQHKLQAGIAALEAQRSVFGDAVVDASIAGLRARLAELAGAGSPGGQALRQVSILFLDLVGSTTLSQRLDPEEIHAVVDGALARFSAIVEAHRGKVLQYAGDNLLAAFGADEVREDDPERAVRCGLALLAEGQAVGKEVQAAHGHAGLGVRVGIHTGGVLLGGGVDGEGSIRGLAVNIAARMEQTAPPGALRISNDTHALVRDRFEVVAQEPMAVKGVDAPIRSWLVQRALPSTSAPARGIEGVATRMVGRETELEAILAAFRRVAAERRLAVITVVAEAGIGKSRLLYEVARSADLEALGGQVLHGRARPQTESQPYGLLREIVAGSLGLGDDDSLERARSKIERGVVPLFAADDGPELAQAHAHLLGHLIGLDFGDSPHIRDIRDEGRQIRRRGFHAAAQALRRIAARDGKPVVLLLDDLHWADEGSLDFLSQLVETNADVPTLVLGTTRPALFERRPDWPGRTEALRLVLGPLGRDESHSLAVELLKKLEAVPPALRELVTRSAEGNPFYMEEVIKMLVDVGAIVVDGGHWTLLHDKLQAARMPPTLTGVLQARLDSLKPRERQALQQAAVVGFVFWDQALAAIDPSAPEALPGIARRELVVRHPEASLDGVREYAFHHHLLHQVTYGTVLKRLRRGYHARAAAWLAGLTGARANDYLGLAAKHYERAGDGRRAAEFFARAAEHAANRYANETVADHVARALALLEDDAEPESLRLGFRLLAVRERALDLQGRRAEHRADVEALEALAERINDDRLRADAAKRHSSYLMRIGDRHGQVEAARRARAWAERAGDIDLQLRAQNLMASGLCDLGDVATGQTLATEGLAAARAHGLRRVEGSFLNTLALIAVRLDDLSGHLEMGRQQWQLFRDMGDVPAYAVARLHLGISLLGAGAHAQSREHLEEGLRLARAADDRVMEPYAQTYLAMITLREGDPESAMTLAQAALETSLAVQNVDTQITSLFQIAAIERARGRTHAAAAAFERAHAIAVANDETMRFDAAAGIAREALARGDGAAAMQALEEVLAHLAEGGVLDGTESRQRIRLTCYEVLSAAGDPRAAAMLDTAYALLQKQADTLVDAALRDNFLNDVPEHREIAAAWAARQAAAAKRPTSGA